MFSSESVAILWKRTFLFYMRISLEEVSGTRTAHVPLFNWLISQFWSLCVFDGAVQRWRTCRKKLRNSSAVCPTLLTARTRDSVMRWDQWPAAKLLREVWRVWEVRCFVWENLDAWKRWTCVCGHETRRTKERFFFLLIRHAQYCANKY